MLRPIALVPEKLTANIAPSFGGDADFVAATATTENHHRCLAQMPFQPDVKGHGQSEAGRAHRGLHGRDSSDNAPTSASMDVPMIERSSKNKFESREKLQPDLESCQIDASHDQQTRSGKHVQEYIDWVGIFQDDGICFRPILQDCQWRIDPYQTMVCNCRLPKIL